MLENLYPLGIAFVHFINYSILREKIMERVRMVGNFELVYEPDMKMYRFMKKPTEDFSRWFTAEEARNLKELNDDDFFASAEKALQSKSKESGDRES